MGDLITVSLILIELSALVAKSVTHLLISPNAAHRRWCLIKPLGHPISPGTKPYIPIPAPGVMYLKNGTHADCKVVFQKVDGHGQWMFFEGTDNRAADLWTVEMTGREVRHVDVAAARMNTAQHPLLLLRHWQSVVSDSYLAQCRTAEHDSAQSCFVHTTFRASITGAGAIVLKCCVGSADHAMELSPLEWIVGRGESSPLGLSESYSRISKSQARVRGTQLTNLKHWVCVVKQRLDTTQGKCVVLRPQQSVELDGARAQNLKMA